MDQCGAEADPSRAARGRSRSAANAPTPNSNAATRTSVRFPEGTPAAAGSRAAVHPDGAAVRGGDLGTTCRQRAAGGSGRSFGPPSSRQERPEEPDAARCDTTARGRVAEPVRRRAPRPSGHHGSPAHDRAPPARGPAHTDSLRTSPAQTTSANQRRRSGRPTPASAVELRWPFQTQQRLRSEL